MGWYRASHFSHVSASPPGWLGVRPPREMRSLNGGWHGLAGWGCFRRFPEAGLGLRADDGANSVSDAGSSFIAADLCLAELRSVSEIPGAQGFSGVLAAKARRATVLRHRGAFQADQAGRTARRRRRVQAALSRQDLQGGLGEAVAHHRCEDAEGGLRLPPSLFELRRTEPANPPAKRVLCYLPPIQRSGRQQWPSKRRHQEPQPKPR